MIDPEALGTALAASAAAYGLALLSALTPATLAGAWTGKTIVARIDDRIFTLLAP